MAPSGDLLRTIHLHMRRHAMNYFIGEVLRTIYLRRPLVNNYKLFIWNAINLCAQMCKQQNFSENLHTISRFETMQNPVTLLLSEKQCTFRISTAGYANVLVVFIKRVACDGRQILWPSICAKFHGKCNVVGRRQTIFTFNPL